MGFNKWFSIDGESKILFVLHIVLELWVSVDGEEGNCAVLHTVLGKDEIRFKMGGVLASRLFDHFYIK